MKKLCLATQNKNKIKEIRHKLQAKFPNLDLIGLEDLGHTEELEETQDTLEGNAFQKANFVWQKYKVDCFAEDTGLEVRVLNNAPGVYSARYAGLHRSDQDNIELLLKNLGQETERQAQFRTVICLILQGEVFYFEGILKGLIIKELRGNNGFGYDPVFMPEGYTQTLAEMNLEQKNQLSHRAKAVEKLIHFEKLSLIRNL